MGTNRVYYHGANTESSLKDDSEYTLNSKYTPDSSINTGDLFGSKARNSWYKYSNKVFKLPFYFFDC